MLYSLSQLFITLTILISLITFLNQIIRHLDNTDLSPFYREITNGIMAGIVGCIVMMYSLQTIRGFMVDFRVIPIILAGIYLSLPSALAASIVIGVIQIIMMGYDSNSINNLIMGIGNAFVCGMIGRSRFSNQVKLILSAFFACLIFSLLLVISPPPMLSSSHAMHIIFSYLLGIAFVLLIMYFFMRYILDTNSAYLQMRDAVNRDYLTGLNNIRQFDKLFNEALENSKSNNQSLSVLFIDIDYFKKINDTYGHLEGDHILKEVSKILTGFSSPNTIISRNGGEEFSVILLACALDEAAEIGEQIRKTVDQHIFVMRNSGKIHITVSIGISSYPFTTAEVDELLEQADMAMYAAKKTGRNRAIVAG